MKAVLTRCAVFSPMVFMLVMAACKFPSAPTDTELVSNLRFLPAAFDSFRRNCDIHYTLKTPEHVSLTIIQRATGGPELRVRTLFTNLAETQGTHSHTWLGDTDQGCFAPPGEYVGVVVVRGLRYEAVVRIFHY